MHKTEQEVEVYFDMIKARDDMRKHIDSGWSVHSFAMNTCANTDSQVSTERILVVYERELNIWN